jgi:F0F1-type ATP synthase delta subunit
MDKKLEKYKGLIELTKTTEDLVDLGDEIDSLMHSLYHVDLYKFEDALSQFVRLRIAREIRKLIQLHSLNTKDEIKEFFSDAYRAICRLPILRLTLAFEPSESIINTISHWARTNLEEGVLLDLSMDRSVLGGAVIVYRGKFYDYSISKKLKEIFDRGDLTL